VAGYCKHSNKPSNYIKDGFFLLNARIICSMRKTVPFRGGLCHIRSGIAQWYLFRGLLVYDRYESGFDKV
jgi:hypothetical protein